MAGHREGLVRVVIHQSLVRPMMFMGGERTLVILSILISAYMGYLVTMRYSVLVGIGLGVCLWLVLINLLRRMAASDAQMWAVIMRAKRYRPFYAARGRFSAFSPDIKDFK